MRLDKAPTGISGFDEIAEGGLPRSRVTLVQGTAGSGKTAFALETLYRGAVGQGEPGLFVAFEESPGHVDANASTFGWHPGEGGQADVSYVDARLPESMMQEGDFDLLGLLAGLTARAEETGARRVVFDGLDVLLDLLDDPRAARREVARLREWVLEHDMVGLITAKADGARPIEPLDFMQFAVDCVVSLRHVTAGRTSHRTLQIAKYRGSPHSADEYPIAITRSGIVVSARGGARIDHVVTEERVPTGVEQLDQLVGGGYWRGSSILVSGAPGTAKTTLAGAFVRTSCERGEPAVFVSFDESAKQIQRNLRSVGIDLAPHVDSGMLRMASFRTRSTSLELHIDRILRMVDEQGARCLVVDPISGFQHVGQEEAAEDAAVLLVDACKQRGLTLIVTSLIGSPNVLVEETPVGLSTIADVWIHVAYVSQGGERNRTLSVIKARGTGHSNQVRELVLGDGEIRLADVYTAGGEVLLGTLRWEKEEEVRRARKRERHEAERRRLGAERELEQVRQRIADLGAEQKALESTLAHLADTRAEDERARASERAAVRSLRGGPTSGEEEG